MNPFTSSIQKTIPNPYDEGQSLTIRKLAPRHLEAAQREAQRQFIENLKSMGGGAAVKDARTVLSVSADEVQGAKVESAADPLSGYDRVTLVWKAVLAWTYPQDPKLVASIEDLDEETLQFYATEVMRLARPALFHTADETEAASKNG